MKLKSLRLSLTLLLVMSFVLLGVNYRLNHPPLSNADKDFRALVSGADSVQMSQMSCPWYQACLKNVLIEYKPLDANQTRELTQRLRFTDDRLNPLMKPPPRAMPLILSFRRKGKEITRYTLWETPRSMTLVHITPSAIDASYKLQPSFVKPLREYLNTVAPKRLQP